MSHREVSSISCTLCLSTAQICEPVIRVVIQCLHMGPVFWPTWKFLKGTGCEGERGMWCDTYNAWRSISPPMCFCRIVAALGSDFVFFESISEGCGKSSLWQYIQPLPGLYVSSSWQNLVLKYWALNCLPVCLWGEINYLFLVILLIWLMPERV